jgi:molecular chaperone GrpE
MTCNNFRAILKKNGLEAIDVRDKKFDPHLHEILGMQEVKEDKDDHLVIEEVQKGYLCEGKVLRTAKVVVGIKKNNDNEVVEEGNG